MTSDEYIPPWHNVADQKPDVDTTVLIFNAGANEPVWLGWFDGEIWRYIDGMPAMPSHWTEIPGGPEA
ncbi:hypothetical protein SAMN06265795_12216 [Noviherbaspirillum humi]|uniref:DUF551 domain-containing protein n=1 Tax=Noviherbaspirillum humi TaxID=1688639 RepID=A0A239LE42_9BURK|nr:hypothetical protein [Noviherbaspirillum humi]SNT28595.1 hypothetical protein SAMN06265795_12216 [Noviherbaspirillum humi]